LSFNAPIQADSTQVTASDDTRTAAVASTDSEPATANHDATSGGHGWGYEGRNGPDSWGGLSKDYYLCKQGDTQSPIDLARFEGIPAAEIEFDYRLSPLQIVNNGHTIQVNYAPGSGIAVNGERYELLQFHFHTPSEHAVQGDRSAMEMLLVHKSAEGKLAVIGILMNLGDENIALNEVWSQIPRNPGREQTVDRVLINARDFLPRDTRYYRYMGSLTTPPCSEGVNWYVLASPVTASMQQVEQFSRVIGENARPLQAVKNRLILGPILN
jgi:carbonic anhydrase